MKLGLILNNKTLKTQGSSMLRHQSLEMLHKQPWLNFINQLKMFLKQDLFIPLENPKTVHNPRCLSTQLISTLYQLSDRKVLTAFTLPISKELLKKYGNTVEEFSTKEDIKILIRMIKTTLMVST